MAFPNWASADAATVTRRGILEIGDEKIGYFQRFVPDDAIQAAKLALKEKKIYHPKEGSRDWCALELLNGYNRALGKFEPRNHPLIKYVSNVYYDDRRKNPRQYPWLDEQIREWSRKPRGVAFEQSGENWVDVCRSKGVQEQVLQKISEIALEWWQWLQLKIKMRTIKRNALVVEARDHGFLTRVFARDYGNLLEAMRQDLERQVVDLNLQYAFQTSPRPECPYPAMRVHYMKEPAPHGAVVVRRSPQIQDAIGIAWRRPHEHADLVFYPDGRVYATPAGLRAIPFLDALSTGIGADQLGKLFDHCMICGKPVSTEESLERAMGPVCTERYAAMMTLLLGDLKRRNLNNTDACIVNAFLEPRGIDALAAAPEMATVIASLSQRPELASNVLSETLEEFGQERGLEAIVAFLAGHLNAEPARVVTALDEVCLALVEYGNDGAYLPYRHPLLTMDILKWVDPKAYEWLRKRWVRAALAADFDIAR